MRTSCFSKLVIISLVLIFGIFLGKLYCLWHKFLNTPLIPPNQNIVYIFHEGSTIKDLANFLAKKGYLKHPNYLVWQAKLTGISTQLQAGEYLFSGGMKPQELLEKLKSGDVIQHQVTFIEGWNFNQVLMALANAKPLQHTLTKVTPQEIMQRLGSIYLNPEGLFFPDTYRYPRDTVDFSILKTAYTKMQKILQQAWANRDLGLPYKNPYQALIVASLIEKEASLAEERPLIAGVIINRINKHMYLQIDPTVIFAMGDKYQGILTDADLHIQSPYNTYLYKGLPPTPIAMPSASSIAAAMHPTKTQYLYFVAKGDGSHYFSVDLKQHDAAIIKYILNKREKNNLPNRRIVTPMTDNFICILMRYQLKLLCKIH